MKFTYYKLGNRKYSLEKIDDSFYELMLCEDDAITYINCFYSKADALTFILSESTITEEEWSGEEN